MHVCVYGGHTLCLTPQSTKLCYVWYYSYYMGIEFSHVGVACRCGMWVWRDVVCLTPHMMHLVDLAQLREPPANSLILRTMADALRPPLTPLYQTARLWGGPAHQTVLKNGQACKHTHKASTHAHMHRP